MNLPATHAPRRARVIMGCFMDRVAIHSAVAICAIVVLSNVWPAETARGEDLAQPARGHQHRAQRHSAGVANAGRPVVKQGAATGAAPTASELDEREHMMTSRPKAGPALEETAFPKKRRPPGAMPPATDPARN